MLVVVAVVIVVAVVAAAAAVLVVVCTGMCSRTTWSRPRPGVFEAKDPIPESALV